MYKKQSWPVIDPGEFRHQVTLLEQVTTSDVSGVSVDYQPDSPPVTAWAKIEWIKGDDLIKAGQDIGRVYGKITAWYRPQFSANKRIQSSSGNQYVIQSVENVLGMSVHMVLMVEGIGTNN